MDWRIWGLGLLPLGGTMGLAFCDEMTRPCATRRGEIFEAS